MKNFVLFFLIVAIATHCSKSKDDSKPDDASIVGRWKLDMHRADPGDGSGTWQKYTGNEIIIEFNADNSFTDSRGGLYNRYSVSGDTITLASSTQPETALRLIQNLDFATLSYYYGGFWCGGPTGEKFVRFGIAPHK